jgi:N6-L-threonylcarbamoyladenine synthase
MLTLGIETTCDETGLAIIRGTNEILSNQIASQIDLHRPFGGVLPELASRQHAEVIVPLIDQTLKEAKVSLSDLDLIGVAKGPGLLGALLVGLNAAKSLSIALNIPFIGVDHLEAHLFAALMGQQVATYPALGVIASGGHTNLVLCESADKFKSLGETHDDAIGEAFDKVAKMMGLPYPGGPEIEVLAKLGNPNRFHFRPPIMKEAPFSFSLSGVKTKVLYTLFGQDFKGHVKPIEYQMQCDIAASFQKGVFEDLIEKSLRAAHAFGCQTLLFGGGVTSSQTLRSLFEERKGSLNLLWPDRVLSLDNGAMIGGLAAHLHQNGRAGDSLSLTPYPRGSFNSASFN